MTWEQLKGRGQKDRRWGEAQKASVAGREEMEKGGREERHSTLDHRTLGMGLLMVTWKGFQHHCLDFMIISMVRTLF